MRKQIAALALVLIVGACASDDQIEAEAPASTTADTVATAPIDPPAGVRHCTPADVVVTFGTEAGAAAGHGTAQIVVTNVGREPCVVFDEIEVTAHGTPDYDETDVPRDDSVPVDYVDPLVAVGEAVGITLHNASPADFAGGQSLFVELHVGGEAVDHLHTNSDEVRLFGVPESMSFQSPVQIWSAYGKPDIIWPSDGSGGIPIGDDDVISTVGMGAIVAGSALAEVVIATGQAVVPTERNVASLGCGYARLGGAATVTLYLHSDSGALDDVVVSAVEIADSLGGDHRTPSGVRPGSSEADLFAALGTARLTPTHNEYTDETDWLFAPADPSERGSAVFFRMRTGVVESITAGLASDVHRGEGCA